MTRTFTRGLAALALGATVLSAAATPALADPGNGNGHGYGRDRDRGDWDRGRDDHRGDRGRDRDWNRGPGRWDRGPDRVVVEHRYAPPPPPRVVHVYDYNRPDPRWGGYYANRYYRAGGGYTPIRVTRETRIYRGSDDRYYCRRSDGTTGLIVGAALGGVIGNSLDRGRSNVLGTILGASAGGLLGREIDRGGVSCR